MFRLFRSGLCEVHHTRRIRLAVNFSCLRDTASCESIVVAQGTLHALHALYASIGVSSPHHSFCHDLINVDHAGWDVLARGGETSLVDVLGHLGVWYDQSAVSLGVVEKARRGEVEVALEDG